ncbi:MAG: universal stress protein [Bacteroidota bacterium]
MKTILVPTDFSEQAQFALDFATQIAKKNDTKIFLFHVLEIPVGTFAEPLTVNVGGSFDADFVKEMTDNAKKEINKLAEQFAGEGVDIETYVDLGSPYEGISHLVSEKQADLIVMGSKGASGLSEIFIGSNAEKVVRRSECPVIVVKQKTDTTKIKNIVFGTGIKDVSEGLMMKLKQLQAAFGATLHLVRINTPNNFKRDEDIKRSLKALASRHMLKHYTINIYNDMYEDQGLIYFAEEVDADMIALGTHGRTGIAHLISGSLAEDVVNHAIRPIWTYDLDGK